MKIKRIFVLLLIVCFFVTGCTTSDAGSNGTEIEEGNAESKTPSSVMVHFEINPQFTLGLDENNIIVDVLYENLDAKLLFEELDVLDTSYEDGISLILNKAYEMEYIKSDSSEIKMEIMFVGDKSESQEEEATEVLKQPMETFFAEKELAIEIQVPEVTEGIEVKIDTSWSGDTTETYFENNKKIKSIKYDGNLYSCEEYNEKGKVIRQIQIIRGSRYSCSEYDDKGNLIKKIWSTPDADYYEDYYENGILIKQIIEYHDGSRSEILFWENGNEKSHIFERADGIYSELYNDENGNREYDVYIYDGIRQETYYDVNGNTEKMLFYHADGTYGELYLYPNGNKKLEIWDNADGTRSEYHYDENGNLISE